jgi:hypothetical protein
MGQPAKKRRNVIGDRAKVQGVKGRYKVKDKRAKEKDRIKRGG